MQVTASFIRKRLFGVLVVLSVVFLLLMGRLAFIQMVNSPWLTERAKDLWARNIEVQGRRGDILDRNGEVLAYTGSAPSVVAYPVQIKDKAMTADRLAPILGMDRNNLLQMLSKKASSVLINPQGRKLDEAKATQIRSLNLPGIYVPEEGKRYYPNGSLLSHILGVTGIDSQGLTGLENFYDDRLKGQPGYIKILTDAKGKEMPQQNDEYVAPQVGDNLVLTVDKEIDSFVKREIDDVVATYHPDAVMSIVANPNTGEILAMENYPTFDPVNFRAAPQEVFNRNLAIWKNFEPGSTFKVVTLAAAIEEKKVKLSEGFYDPGYYEVGGRRIRCWKAGGHGQQNFLQVVENSCNPGFMLLGSRLGKETLFSYIRNFGFGSPTGIDIPGEGNGLLFKLSRVGPLELATTSFGQGVAVTPIQQVMALSAIANGGNLMKPYVAKAWVDPVSGQTISQTSPQVVRRVVSPDTAAQVRGALESVVANGSGKNAYLNDYRVGGKTGTAQVALNGRYEPGHYIVSFIGMAPIDNPQLVAYIAIDNPKAPLVFGGVIAAPVVGRILGDSLHYLGVPPSANVLPKKYNYFDVQPVEVPKLEGLSVSDAQKQMIESVSQLKTEVAGSGPQIISQSPAAGTKVSPGSTIRLYLGGSADAAKKDAGSPAKAGQ